MTNFTVKDHKNVTGHCHFISCVGDYLYVHSENTLGDYIHKFQLNDNGTLTEVAALPLNATYIYTGVSSSTDLYIPTGTDYTSGYLLDIDLVTFTEKKRVGRGMGMPSDAVIFRKE